MDKRVTRMSLDDYSQKTKIKQGDNSYHLNILMASLIIFETISLGGIISLAKIFRSKPFIKCFKRHQDKRRFVILVKN
jgi:hypothetical protein